MYVYIYTFEVYSEERENQILKTNNFQKSSKLSVLCTMLMPSYEMSSKYLHIYLYK